MSLSPQSQLILRNEDQFEQGNWLVINPDDANLFSALSHLTLTVLHQYYDVFNQCARRLEAAHFDSRDMVENKANFALNATSGNHSHIFAPTCGDIDGITDVLIFMPKAKAHLAMLMAMAANLAGNGNRVHVIGENRGGIKSAGKAIQAFGDIDKVDSARHCSWLTCHLNQAPAQFNLSDYLSRDTYRRNGIEWTVCSLPGVFSHRELDAGTAMLLDKLPLSLSGKLLDFACGAGVIASYLLSGGSKASVELLDVSALALWSSAHTLHENHQQGVLIATDTLQGVSTKYHTVVTNPPFHTGVKTDYRISREFIQATRQHLHPKGKLYLVANRFLPYAELLSEQFSSPSVLTQDNRFSVYFAQS
ncbi:methyltransferase [uncultured Alteromonas sp.]|uniref:methyltransferase n=1 Tax=uncultured Alteromonas sp. TaxID=179113 RepID=UPI0025F894E5|nr:methyltransferase [uncultured Alteromonas sp.]